MSLVGSRKGHASAESWHSPASLSCSVQSAVYASKGVPLAWQVAWGKVGKQPAGRCVGAQSPGGWGCRASCAGPAERLCWRTAAWACARAPAPCLNILSGPQSLMIVTQDQNACPYAHAIALLVRPPQFLKSIQPHINWHTCDFRPVYHIYAGDAGILSQLYKALPKESCMHAWR